MTKPVPVPAIDAEPVSSVLRCLQLSSSGADRFEGHSLPQIRRIYGGQVIAQAILAAGATIETEGRRLHSLHAYFLRGGDPEMPLEFQVNRLRDGRSFSSRQVTCTQDDRDILTLSASFQDPGDGVDFQPQMPEVPAPSELRSALEIFRTLDNPVARFLGKTSAFDVRHVQKTLYTGADPHRNSAQQLWMRPRHPLPDPMPQILHRALLAYVVDQVMMEPALRASGLSWVTPGMSLASLDHAMWFHRDLDINQWLLFCGYAGSVSGARASSRVDVFTEDGLLVASANQEGMVRVPTADQSGSGKWTLDA